MFRKLPCDHEGWMNSVTSKLALPHLHASRLVLRAPKVQTLRSPTHSCGARLCTELSDECNCLNLDKLQLKRGMVRNTNYAKVCWTSDVYRHRSLCLPQPLVRRRRYGPSDKQFTHLEYSIQISPLDCTVVAHMETPECVYPPAAWSDQRTTVYLRDLYLLRKAERKSHDLKVSMVMVE